MAARFKNGHFFMIPDGGIRVKRIGARIRVKVRVGVMSK